MRYPSSFLFGPAFPALTACYLQQEHHSEPDSEPLRQTLRHCSRIERDPCGRPTASSGFPAPVSNRRKVNNLLRIRMLDPQPQRGDDERNAGRPAPSPARLGVAITQHKPHDRHTSQDASVSPKTSDSAKKKHLRKPAPWIAPFDLHTATTSALEVVGEARWIHLLEQRHLQHH